MAPCTSHAEPACHAGARFNAAVHGDARLLPRKGKKGKKAKADKLMPVTEPAGDLESAPAVSSVADLAEGQQVHLQLLIMCPNISLRLQACVSWQA